VIRTTVAIRDVLGLSKVRFQAELLRVTDPRSGQFAKLAETFFCVFRDSHRSFWVNSEAPTSDACSADRPIENPGSCCCRRSTQSFPGLGRNRSRP
jgi:hypothetical protein